MGCDALEAPYFNASFVEVLYGILFVVSFGGAVTFPAAAAATTKTAAGQYKAPRVSVFVPAERTTTTATVIVVFIVVAHVITLRLGPSMHIKQVFFVLIE